MPIVISAATLTWLSTWVLTSIAMAAYGMLLFFYVPLLPLDRQLAELGLSFHIVGMWFTFILSALFIAYFIVVYMLFFTTACFKKADDQHYRIKVCRCS